MDRGAIYHVGLDPIHGREQAGKRFVLVVSPKSFNKLGTPFVCPITTGGNFARNSGFAVSIMGAGIKTEGVVLCNQIRALDLVSRNATFVEKVPDFIIDDVVARLRAILE